MHVRTNLYVMKFWILWKMHLEMTMPSTIVERPSSVSTISAAARAASVDPVCTSVRIFVSTITCVSQSTSQRRIITIRFRCYVSTSTSTSEKSIIQIKEEKSHPLILPYYFFLPSFLFQYPSLTWHSYSHIRSLQCWSIIHSISCHSNLETHLREDKRGGGKIQ